MSCFCREILQGVNEKVSRLPPRPLWSPSYSSQTVHSTRPEPPYLTGGCRQGRGSHHPWKIITLLLKSPIQANKSW